MQNYDYTSMFDVKKWYKDEHNEHVVPGMMALGPGGPKGMIIVGPTGTGKTYTAIRAAYSYWKKSGGTLETKVSMVGYPDLRARLGAAMGASRRRDSDADTTEEIIRRYQAADVLLMDDACTGRGSDWTRDVWWQILDRRWTRAKPGLTILTSNVHPRDRERWLDHLGEKGLSRLRALVGGHIFVLKGPDRRLPDEADAALWGDPSVLPEPAESGGDPYDLEGLIDTLPA
jgi:DNA replication protein DnaC